jgi:hypothetical protein
MPSSHHCLRAVHCSDYYEERGKGEAMNEVRQLENLLWQQTEGWHPYTCGNKSRHKPLFYRNGKLLCHDCTYEQPFNLSKVLNWFGEDDPDEVNRALRKAHERN